MYDISRYINSNGLKVKFKPVIHCTTGPLYPEMRKEISEEFNNAHVYSFYGSRQVSSIATEIKSTSWFQVLFDNVFVEILDENSKPVKEGEEGEVVITTLNNFYMPLIRYRIGDRAIKGDSFKFGCLRIENILGRTLGVIHTKDGRKIDGQFFTTLFFNKESIKSFQLVQKSIDLLILNIVKSDSFIEDELNLIVERIKLEVPNVQIAVSYCKNINLSSTGKIMYVYSEL